MANQSDVRRIALSLPEVSEDADRFAFSVRAASKQKGIAWVWLEKEMLLASDEEKFFTEPHYNGFPAILVRLAAIDVDELAELITDAWRCQAPKVLVKELERREQP
jgi:hypothetical protein